MMKLARKLFRRRRRHCNCMTVFNRRYHDHFTSSINVFEADYFIKNRGFL